MALSPHGLPTLPLGWPDIGPNLRARGRGEHAHKLLIKPEGFQVRNGLLRFLWLEGALS